MAAGPASLYGSCSVAAEQQRLAFVPSRQPVAASPAAPPICCAARPLAAPPVPACSSPASVRTSSAARWRGAPWARQQEGRRAAQRTVPNVASGAGNSTGTTQSRNGFLGLLARRCSSAHFCPSPPSCHPTRAPRGEFGER